MNDKVKAPAIPAGFEQISDGTLATDHDFKKTPIVQGIIKSLKTVQIRRAGNKLEDNRLMLIDAEGAPIAVWESANLQDLFDSVVKGDTVYIEFTGEVDLDNGLNPMKQFVTAIKPTGNRDAKPDS